MHACTSASASSMHVRPSSLPILPHAPTRRGQSLRPLQCAMEVCAQLPLHMMESRVAQPPTCTHIRTLGPGPPPDARIAARHRRVNMSMPRARISPLDACRWGWVVGASSHGLFGPSSRPAPTVSSCALAVLFLSNGVLSLALIAGASRTCSPAGCGRDCSAFTPLPDVPSSPSHSPGRGCPQATPPPRAAQSEDLAGAEGTSRRTVQLVSSGDEQVRPARLLELRAWIRHS
jgi:hypothetical protein